MTEAARIAAALERIATALEKEEPKRKPAKTRLSKARQEAVIEKAQAAFRRNGHPVRSGGAQWGDG
jgi:hypothetical protein